MAYVGLELEVRRHLEHACQWPSLWFEFWQVQFFLGDLSEVQIREHMATI